MPRLFKRIGNPLEWSAADRCLLAALVCLTFNILYILAGLYYLSTTATTRFAPCAWRWRGIDALPSWRRMDYTAIGRQVNLSARLEAQCEPGNVLMSQSTYALVADEIPCQLKGEIRVKGIHHPVQVYSPSESYDDTSVDG